jgi:hypothetical protein
MQKAEDPQLIRDYLLKALDEHRQAEFEHRLLADANLQAELSETQHDLIDDYVFGLLNDREKALFEKNFALNDERLHIMRLSEAMLKYTESNSAVAGFDEDVARRFGWRVSLRFLRKHKLAAACVAIILLAAGYGLWTIYNHQQLKRQLAILEAKRLAIENELARINSGKLPDSSAKTTTITLRPLLRESGEPNQPGNATNTDFLQLNLELMGADYGSYRAVIETSESREMYKVGNLKTDASSGKTLSINLPGQLLPVGSYQIHLIGIAATGEEVDCGRYPFEVVQK